MIIKEIGKTEIARYDAVSMNVEVKSVLALQKIAGGLGGIRLAEQPVEPYVKNLGAYGGLTEAATKFDLTNWAFWLAFDGERAVGGAAVAARTPNVWMLDGRDDLAVLWDLRVADGCKRQGIGTALFQTAADWSRRRGYRQLKIECQNNNVPACRFYAKHGAQLGKIDEYAYSREENIRHEAALIWYLNL